jgi:hypothetical protein
MAANSAADKSDDSGGLKQPQSNAAKKEFTARSLYWDSGGSMCRTTNQEFGFPVHQKSRMR